MNYCFKAYGTAFLRGRFTIKKFMRLKVRIACDPIVYLKPYCMPLREDGHDGNWLIGGSFIKFRFWMNGEFISCGPLRATADDTRVIHEFEFDELSSGEHLLAVAFRGERDGISIELIPDKGTAPEIDWKIFDARLFCSPVAWKHPNIYGYFKGDIGPGEYFEHLDGTLYPDNWNNAFYFNDAKWETPQIAETELKNHSAEYNYEQEYQFPSKLWKNSRGNYIVDFETVAVGSVRLKGPHVGGEIELRLGEELLNGDCVRYQYRCGVCSQEIWTFKAGGQTLEHFGVRTFRYVEIVGYQGEMRITDLGRLLIRAPFRDVAELKTPVKALTDIWQLCKNSVRNIGVDYFVDCFTRERLAYEADTLLVMGSSFVMNADLRLVKPYIGTTFESSHLAL